MPISIARLRNWFAWTAIAIIVVVTGAYLIARWQLRKGIQVPGKLGINIQQSTDAFTLSKSAAGRTLFTIRANKAVQYKAGGRAELHNVTIVVYGKESNRFDQIYGDDFEYDPNSGDVFGKGEVNIDLQGNQEGPTRPDQAPPRETKNPVHVTTSGVHFNQKTGQAVTDARVEFHLAQANGSAVGALYDSKGGSLVLNSQVDITTTGKTVINIKATKGTLTKQPRQVVLEQPHLTQPDQTLDADQGIVFLRPDDSAERIVATGNVRMERQDDSNLKVRAPRGELELAGPKNEAQSGVLSGGVEMQTSGDQPMQGWAEQVLFTFGPHNQATHARALQNVRLLQHQVQGNKMVSGSPKPSAGPENSKPEDVELDAAVLDMDLKEGKLLERAHTEGPAQIVITSQPAPAATARTAAVIIPTAAAAPAQPKPSGPERTVVTAKRFDFTFDDHNHLKTLHGAPNAKIVSTTPGQPDRISTSRILDVAFKPAGGIGEIIQRENLRYNEGERAAWGEVGRYTPDDGMLVLNGDPPRIVDQGTTTTGDVIRLNRTTGEAVAIGNVKSTYSDLKPQPNGAMLASGDPVHVTAKNMTAGRASGQAVYTGGARLWQNANVVEAPIITFDRNTRSMTADGTPAQRVMTVLVQTDKKGKVTPVNIRSDALNYVDDERKAHFSGGVVMKATDATLSSQEADAFLKPRQQEQQNQGSTGGPRQGSVVSEPSQLDRVVAWDHVVVIQPSRRVLGEHLVYTAADGKYVVTGGAPSIFDAEKGISHGDSLTFYNRDDRVLIESKDSKSSPTVTQTRVAR
jgi:lipopolysaccharide export system protein LptA